MHTASTIRSVVAGRSERLKHRVYEATGLGEVFNDSNVHLSIKSSPDKTNHSLSLIAEKQGSLCKLNDTGSWRKRRALLVPHTFLYYFGEQTAATDFRPHGVIDLELYTDIQVVDETVVRLAPGDDTSPIRTFYLRLADEDEAQVWAQAIREMRFDYVRGERDALRSAKACLTDQLVEQDVAIRESQAALEASLRRESAAVSELARRDAEEARRVEQVRALLAASIAAPASGSCSGSGSVDSNAGAVGSSVAATALSDLAALEEAIEERAREVASLKLANEALREKEAHAADRCRRDVADALRVRDQDRERAAEESALRSDLEVELRRLRAELEESRASRDEARANLGVVAAACREADAKSRELQEHRRVLAREVKASRAEQKRLSAALSCATTAAAAAAATAAAATKVANSANAMATTGDQEVLSPTAGCAAGDDGVSYQVAADQAQGREGGAEQGGGGREGGGPVTSGVETSMEGPLSHEGQQGEGFGEEFVAQAETPGGGPTQSLAVQRSTSSSSENEAVPGAEVSEDDATTSVTAVAASDTAPLWVRPSSLDVPGELMRQGEGEDSAGGTESGATSPETESPGVFPAEVSESGSVRNGGDDERTRSGTHRLPSSPSSGSLADPLKQYSSDFDARESNKKIDEPRGAELPDSAEGGEKEEGSSSSHDGRSGAIIEPENGSGRCAAAAAETAKTPASPSASLAAAVGESSSLRFNHMVQSFSAGLRESRRARRTPLLGSLDDTDDDDDHPGGFADLGDDDGGGTDGTGNDEGDTRHDTDAAAPASTRTRSATWSTRSVVVVGGRNSGSLHGRTNEQERRREVSAPASAGSGSAGGGRCASDGVDGQGSLEATADTIAQQTAVAVAGTNPASEWLRILGRPDGEDVRLVEGRDPRQTQEDRRCDLPSLLLPGRERSESGVGDAGGGATLNPAAGSAAVGEGDADGGVGGAAVAVAMAAAERGGALSAEAAAAARRWEAKLKGSLVSMTEGVRWGLGPQRPNDVEFFKS